MNGVSEKPPMLSFLSSSLCIVAWTEPALTGRFLLTLSVTIYENPLTDLQPVFHPLSRWRRCRRWAKKAPNYLLSVLAALARHPILCSPRDGGKLPGERFHLNNGFSQKPRL